MHNFLRNKQNDIIHTFNIFCLFKKEYYLKSNDPQLQIQCGALIWTQKFII